MKIDYDELQQVPLVRDLRDRIQRLESLCRRRLEAVILAQGLLEWVRVSSDDARVSKRCSSALAEIARLENGE